MKYSIIIILEEKYSDFPLFVTNLHELFSQRDEPFEVFIIANGTGDFLKSQIPQLTSIVHSLNAFEFPFKTTQAVCLKAALKEISGEILVICGSYQQITSESLNYAIDCLDTETDLVNPWRQQRVDPYFNQIQSKVFNYIVRKAVKYELHDFNCKIKVCRRNVLEQIELYGNMYRFLPTLAVQNGFNIKEVNCKHFQEPGKTGFYSLSIYVSRILDILTLYFTTHFTKKPLRFFSTIGMSFIFIGSLISAFLIVQRFVFDIPIGNRGMLFISLILITLGVLVASVGLLGEIIVFTYGRRGKEYRIEKKI